MTTSKSVMWTTTTGRRYSRERLRYETDVSDTEWLLLEPLLPKPNLRGRPRAWPLREIVNAIFSVLRGGIAWRLLPKDLPPRTAAYRWRPAGHSDGLLLRSTGRPGTDCIAIMLRQDETARRPSCNQ